MPTFEPFDPTRNVGTLAELIMAPARARANALRIAGEAQARAAQQSGQIWAGAAQNIGQAASGAVQQYAQQKAEAPQREMDQIKLDTARIQLDSARGTQAANQRGVAVQRAVDSLMRDALVQDPTTGAYKYDRPKLQQGFADLGIASEWPKYSDLLDKSDASVEKARAAMVEHMKDDARIVEASGNDAAVFTNLIQRGVKNGVYSEAIAAPYLEAVQRDPAHVERITSALLGKEPPKLMERDPTKDLVSPQTGVVVSPGTGPLPKPVYRQSADKRTLEKVGEVPANAQVVQEAQPPRVTVNAGATGDVPTLPPDPASQDILSQTGLSMNAFYHMTGRTSLLARDRVTRTQAANEAQKWARANGVDISTLPSQYKAYNAALERNIERLNNTKIMEQELGGTIQNLQEVSKQLGRVNFANVWQIWAGKEVNDPTANQYAFHLEQLRNELAAYYAAAAGRPGSGITEKDNKDAERTIKDGISNSGLKGLENAVHNSTAKMGPIMQGSVDRSTQAIWSLFGVGQNYKVKGGASQQPQGGQAPAGFSVVAPDGKTYSFPSQMQLDAFKRRAGIK